MEICVKTCREERHLSKCEKYSYKRCITWCDKKPLCVFVLLNPIGSETGDYSTTVKSCIRIAKEKDYGGIIIVNLFAITAPKWTELKKKIKSGIDVGGIGKKNENEEDKGKINEKYFENALNTPNALIIVAWGSKQKHFASKVERFEEMTEGLKDIRHLIRADDKRKNVPPRHPSHIKPYHGYELIKYKPKTSY